MGLDKARGRSMGDFPVALRQSAMKAQLCASGMIPNEEIDSLTIQSTRRTRRFEGLRPVPDLTI